REGPELRGVGMEHDAMARRQLVQPALVLGAAGAAPASAAERGGKGPRLSTDEMAAVDAPLGKKGTLNEQQGVYTVPLPRNDLKITIHGDPVPIPFGFGGWVSFKKTRDGRATVLMSDTVLLQDEVNPVISAAH